MSLPQDQQITCIQSSYIKQLIFDLDENGNYLSSSQDIATTVKVQSTGQLLSSSDAYQAIALADAQTIVAGLTT